MAEAWKIVGFWDPQRLKRETQSRFKPGLIGPGRESQYREALESGGSGTREQERTQKQEFRILSRES
jgi:hypothetical protein